MTATWPPPQIDRYLIDTDHIGEGGFSFVYKATDPKFPESPLALKMLKPPWVLWPQNWEKDPQKIVTQWEQAKERFLAESQLMRNAKATAIAPVYDSGTIEHPDCGEIPYFTSDFAQSGTFEQRLAERNQPLTSEETQELVTELARILAALAQKRPNYPNGIVHRDIKPSNLLIQKTPGYRPNPSGTLFSLDEELVLTDFGLAKAIAPDNDSFTGTRGTDLYAAPEQLEHDPSVDKTVDIFAATVVLVEALTNTKPQSRWIPAQPLFDEATIQKTAPFTKAVQQALSTDPSQRPQTNTDWEKSFLPRTDLKIEPAPKSTSHAPSLKKKLPLLLPLILVSIVAAGITWIIIEQVTNSNKQTLQATETSADTTGTVTPPTVSSTTPPTTTPLPPTTSKKEESTSTSATVTSSSTEKTDSQNTDPTIIETEETETVTVPAPEGATEQCGSGISVLPPFSFWKHGNNHGDGVTLIDCQQVTLENPGTVGDPEFINHRYWLELQNCYFPGATLRVSDGTAAFQVTSGEDGSCTYNKTVFQADDNAKTWVTFEMQGVPLSETFHYRISSHNA